MTLMGFYRSMGGAKRPTELVRTTPTLLYRSILRMGKTKLLSLEQSLNPDIGCLLTLTFDLLLLSPHGL